MPGDADLVGFRGLGEFDLPTADVELRWHRRVNDDPASQWLRDHLRDIVDQLTAIPNGQPSASPTTGQASER